MDGRPIDTDEGLVIAVGVEIADGFHSNRPFVGQLLAETNRISERVIAAPGGDADQVAHQLAVLPQAGLE